MDTTRPHRAASVIVTHRLGTYESLVRILLGELNTHHVAVHASYAKTVWAPACTGCLLLKRPRIEIAGAQPCIVWVRQTNSCGCE